MQLIDKIFNIRTEHDFTEVCLEVFSYQYNNCPIYRSYCEAIGKTHPSKIEDIPFLPISFFKTHDVTDISCNNHDVIFKSSGTGGERSKHIVTDSSIYERSFIQHYCDAIGNPENQVILALLPSYLEQGESSLVYMVDHLIHLSNNPLSGFVLNDTSELEERYRKAIATGKAVVLFGVSYALLDIAEQNIRLPEAIIIETGGMKGRRKELTKSELHAIIRQHIQPKKVLSEYGMTELLSQAYTDGGLTFVTPKWMRVITREVNDPFNLERQGKTGGINIFDLANVHSCSFIATEDLGKVNDDGFEVLGRFDNSDIRGCNLLIQ